MKILSADEVFRSGAFFGWLMVMPDTVENLKELGEGHKELMQEHFKSMQRFCSELGLPVSEAGCQDVLDELGRDKFSASRLRQAVVECIKRFTIEMKAHLFLYVPPGRSNLHLEPFKYWDNTIAKREAEVSMDIREASRCLALERDTACVFHLMRVMEVGLKSVAAALEIELEWHERSWGTVLGKIKDEIARRNKRDEPKWAKQRAFFEETVVTLVAVKDAWRNTTMHVDKVYEPGRADSIYRMVRDFMEHLYATLT